MNAIEIKNLYKSCDNGFKALKKINLSIKKVKFLLYWDQMELVVNFDKHCMWNNKKNKR